MGMFDYIRVKMPLPSEPPPPECSDFQTKDTDAQYMEHYTIEEDGRLIHHTVAYEEVPKAERPYPNARPQSLNALCGILRRVPTGDVEVPFHGDIGFYEFSRDRGWWSYIARFTEGRCVRIWCNEFSPAGASISQPASAASPTEPRAAAPDIPQPSKAGND
jgi:hypothetical protein